MQQFSQRPNLLDLDNEHFEQVDVNTGDTALVLKGQIPSQLDFRASLDK